MTRRDKIGIAILIGLFVSFIIGLILTVKPLGTPKDPSESFFVQQRIRNLQKNQQ